MKSSFKKIDKSGASQKGGFGHPDLDAVFSNSLPRGHLMVLEEDHPTTNYLSLLRYFVGSNYHESSPTIIYDSNPHKWKNLISPIKKIDKNEKQESTNQQKSEIAWRYDKMNINLNELIIAEDAKFLDLTKIQDKINEALIIAREYPNGSIQEFYKQIQEEFVNCQQDEKDTRHKKILISSMPSYLYKNDKLRQFLRALRCMTRSSHVTTLITIPPIVNEEIRSTFLLYSDTYMQIGKIGQGYTDFCASLTILKQVQPCQIKAKNRGVSIWGIKNRKKELRIESLYEEVIEETLGDQGKDSKQSIQF